MHPFHHAVSSAKKFGGQPADYLAVHQWFDASKAHIADVRHRFLRHHAEGIFMAEREFGITITNSAQRQVPVRFIGEQHVKEDLGRIPTVADWANLIAMKPWMQRPGLSREDREEIEATPIPSEEAHLGAHGLGPARIFHVLDVSTTHITEEDSKRITLNEHLIAYEDECGWWIYVPDRQDCSWEQALDDYPMSAQFVAVLIWAQGLGCDYVRLDRDGAVYEEWAQYDW